MNKYQLARRVCDEYNKEFLQGNTFLHIQEWLDEKGKKRQTELLNKKIKKGRKL